MLLELLRGDCSDGKTCPALHGSDRGTVVIQGQQVADIDQLNVTAGQQAVEVPTWLLAEALDTWPALQLTDHDTVIVPGTLVTDLDTLRQLRLAADEVAVEVPPTFLAKVLQAC